MLKQMGCWAVVGWGLGFACPALGQEACPAVEVAPLEGHDRTVVTGLNNWGQVSAFSYREGGGPATGSSGMTDARVRWRRWSLLGTRCRMPSTTWGRS